MKKDGGLERQTLESLEMLRRRGTPFIVALNKCDRIHDWVSSRNSPIRDSLSKQKDHTVSDFDDKVRRTVGAFQTQGLNARLYFDRTLNIKDGDIPIVPTSARTGEGIPDLLMLLIQYSQKQLKDRIAFVDFPQATVMEVKEIAGLGTTLDACLVSGSIREGDTIVACTMEGPVTTTVRSVLTPEPARESRVKGSFMHHKEMKGAMGVKICAHGLEKALAGT